MEEDNRGKKGKGHEGTRIKDPWTKPKWVGGGEGWWGEEWGWEMETTVLEQQ